MDQGPNFVDFSDNIFKDYLTKKNREFSIPPDQNSWILKKYFQGLLEIGDFFKEILLRIF